MRPIDQLSGHQNYRSDLSFFMGIIGIMKKMRLGGAENDICLFLFFLIFGC